MVGALLLLLEVIFPSLTLTLCNNVASPPFPNLRSTVAVDSETAGESVPFESRLLPIVLPQVVYYIHTYIYIYLFVYYDSPHLHRQDVIAIVIVVWFVLAFFVIVYGVSWVGHVFFLFFLSFRMENTLPRLLLVGAWAIRHNTLSKVM